MDQRLKDLIQELGSAVNESLSQSERIASAIEEIKNAGYQVHLVLEATIGRNDNGQGDDQRPTRRRVGKIKFTITQEPDDATL